MANSDERNIDPSAPPPIRIRIERGKAEGAEFCFRESFRIGRDKSCEVQICDLIVSRLHAEIWFAGGRWWVHDLQSANGTFVDGKRVERLPLSEETRIGLGANGPVLYLKVEAIPQAELTPMGQHSVTQYMQRYFSDTCDEKAGKHTMMIRRAFEKVQKKQKRKFAWVIAVVVCLLLATAAYAVFKHFQVRKQSLLAQEIFYAMKSLEVQFAEFLRTARLNKDEQSRQHVETYRVRRKELEERYDRFIESLRIYEESISQEESIILRMARTFGECEISMPEGFVKEVLSYIKKWKSTRRFEKAIARAKRNGFVSAIAESLLAQDLPPQFLYLALQESNFNASACGPKTKYGIAKGMWQFIPSTAFYYGLKTGPLVSLRRPDPHDDRHDFEKSTRAAARYLRDIYDTDAQASGLLVMASYNWGERRVNELIRMMPKNPRERNFWRVLENHRNQIPKETYDYVFYIFSAAVIGENPRLFGFDLDNPIAPVEEKFAG
jgi:pSer/pThr/pTyr-binding forkhead associated (FHA) protein